MKSSLGRGLQSLIPQKKYQTISLPKKQTDSANWLKPKKESIFNIELDKIRPNPLQPRQDLSNESLKELADSIREHGVLQPLIVTKIEKATERGQQVEYELVAGERRWRAARLAGLPHVPVIIRNSAAQEKLELALVENVQRENLNAMEAAFAYKQLQEDFGLRHEDIAKKIGKERATIANTVRLLTLPKVIQEAILSDRIQEGHGRALLLARPEARLALFRKTIKNSLSVRQIEDEARKQALPGRAAVSGPKSPLFRKLENDLQQVIGRRVSITKRKDLGHIRIEFINQQELEKLTNHLLKF